MVSGAELCGGAGDADDAAEAIDVWACNFETVAVFEACRIEVVGGMAPSYNGLSAQEIAAACDLLGVPADARRDLCDDVQWMGRVVTGALNRRIADAPRNKG